MKNMIFAVGLMLACSASAEQPSGPAYTDSDIGVSFPKTLGGLAFKEMHKYKEPELGYSLRYRGNDITIADVYVYDKKLTDIPTGHDNSILKAEAAEIMEVLNIMQKRGDYRNVRVTKTGVKPETASFRFLWNRFEYIQASKTSAYKGIRISESFVTGYKGKFVKVRLDYKKTDAEEGQRTSDRLGEELAQFLAAADATTSVMTPDAVLKAIKLFRQDPLGPEGVEAVALILTFAVKSPDVTVSISRVGCPWIGDREYKNSEVLLAAFAAGNIEQQLTTGQDKDHTYEGVLQVLATYAQLRKSQGTERVQSIEKLITLQQSGGLKAYIEKQVNEASQDTSLRADPER